MIISSRVSINKHTLSRDGVAVPALQENADTAPEMLYRYLQCNYPKFFKMDKLCKWAVVAAELLFSVPPLHAGTDKNKVGIVLATAHGCIDVDRRYFDGIAVPSPALFVYTLPNIMLGEICIRHGFKGEQLCMVSEHFDAPELFFSVHHQLITQGMEACLCGWVDVNEEDHDVHLFWVKKSGNGLAFDAQTIHQLYDAASSNFAK